MDMKTIRVRDLMTTPALSVGPGSSVAAVRDLMSERGIRHVPVVDENRSVIGVVSQRDVLRSTITTIDADSAHRTEVRDIMTRDVDTLDASENIATAGEMMLACKYGCIPVVDGTTLIGVLTEADFIRYLVEKR